MISLSSKVKGAGLGVVLSAWLLVGCRSDAPAPKTVPMPSESVLLTATGNIRALAVDGAGRLWAATGGGALCWPPGAAAPRCWTTADGLPGNDVRAIRPAAQGVEVETTAGLSLLEGATASAVHNGWTVSVKGLRQGENLIPLPAPLAALGAVTAIAQTPDSLYLATSLDLWRRTDGRWTRVSLPPESAASHVSALCAQKGQGVVAGLYGDGIYRLDGSRWTHLPGQPAACRSVVALADAPDGLAVGTRADGVWQCAVNRGGEQWRSRPDPTSLPAGDIQTLAAFGGSLWAGTLDAGLLQYDGARVRHWTRADGLSADSPRGLAAFGGKLYVRYATGQTDCFDGAAWRAAFTKDDLPRPQVYSLAADAGHLYLGGWASWASTDGQTWERHFHDPELADQVVTAIAPAPDGSVWLGTQKQGLLHYAQGRYTRFQESQGLTDDWITCLGLHGTRVCAGTYTGGLLEKQGERFVMRLNPQKFAIRTIAFAPDTGRILAATPVGTYEETAAAGWTLLPAGPSGGLETQALLPTPQGTWVGGRTGLAFLRMKTP